MQGELFRQLGDRTRGGGAVPLLAPISDGDLVRWESLRPISRECNGYRYGTRLLAADFCRASILIFCHDNGWFIPSVEITRTWKTGKDALNAYRSLRHRRLPYRLIRLLQSRHLHPIRKYVPRVIPGLLQVPLPPMVTDEQDPPHYLSYTAIWGWGGCQRVLTFEATNEWEAARRLTFCLFGKEGIDDRVFLPTFDPDLSVSIRLTHEPLHP